MNSSKTFHETYPPPESASFTFIIHQCDKAGFTGIRDWYRLHPDCFVIFGYSDDECQHPQDIRGYTVLATTFTMHDFQNTLLGAIHHGGGSYSRISSEMDQLDPEITITWCMQKPFTCQLGKRPTTWSSSVQDSLQEDSLPPRIITSVEPVTLEENTRPSYSFSCSWCTDCDVNMNVDLDLDRK